MAYGSAGLRAGGAAAAGTGEVAPYHYADNNPIDNIDPWGLRPLTDQDLAAQEDGGGFDWGAFGHGALDIIGFIPVLGEPADLIDAGWYAAEGDGADAGLSAAGVIPGPGVAAVGSRILGRTADLVHGGDNLIDLQQTQAITPNRESMSIKASGTTRMCTWASPTGSADRAASYSR